MCARSASMRSAFVMRCTTLRYRAPRSPVAASASARYDMAKTGRRSDHPVEPRDVGRRVAVELRQHLDRIRLRRCPGRPPLHFRRRLPKLVLQVIQAPIDRVLIDRDVERARHLEGVQHVGREVRARGLAHPGPEGEAAVAALVAVELLEQRRRPRPRFRRRGVREAERAAEVRREQERQRTRGPLLGAFVRVFIEIASALTEPDERGGGQLHSSDHRRPARCRRAARPSRARASSCRRTRPRSRAATGTVTGSDVSNASVSPPSVTVICTRAEPDPRAVASKCTGNVAPCASRSV